MYLYYFEIELGLFFYNYVIFIENNLFVYLWGEI